MLQEGESLRESFEGGGSIFSNCLIFLGRVVTGLCGEDGKIVRSLHG